MLRRNSLAEAASDHASSQYANRLPKPPTPSDPVYISLMNKNEINMETIKVYAVIGGFNYEGEVFDSLKIFTSESSALEYKAQLIEEGFDYVQMEIKELDV
jgi:hypothetical protein